MTDLSSTTVESAYSSTLQSKDWSVAHDFMYTNGGAEAVTRWLCADVLPGSPLSYLAGDERVVASVSSSAHAPILSKFVTESNYRSVAPAIPLILRARRPFVGNLLISSYAFATGLRAEGAKAIYCHSPLRQAWSGASTYASHGPFVERLGSRALKSYFRHYDRLGVDSSDVMIATSRAVQARIREYYGRDSELIPPPIDDQTFYPDSSVEREEIYVWAGRITEPYKKLGIVLDAFRSMPDRRLVVVGNGRDRARLERTSPANVHFVGWRSREELAGLYRRARGLIFPSEDDFGLVPVEAMASGCPVLAFGRGGALDTVEPGFSGVLFDRQDADTVEAGISALDSLDTPSTEIADNALRRWGRSTFRQRMSEVLVSVQK